MSTPTVVTPRVVLTHVAATIVMLLVVAGLDWLFSPFASPRPDGVRVICAIGVFAYAAVYHLLTPPSAA